MIECPCCCAVVPWDGDELELTCPECGAMFEAPDPGVDTYVAVEDE